jgi:hypothetical protein
MLNPLFMGDDEAPLKGSHSAAPTAKLAASSSPPVTDEIDSEWGSPAEAFEPLSSDRPSEAASAPKLVAARPPMTAEQLSKPNFPADPGVPAGFSPTPPARRLEKSMSKGRARAEHAPVASSSPPPPRGRTTKVVIMAGLAAAVVWFVRGTPSEDTAQSVAPDVAAAQPQPLREESTPPASVQPAVEPPALASAPAPASSAAPPTVNGAEGSASPSAASAEPARDGKIAVVIRVQPASGRIFYHGKDQGRPPLTVELEPGKKRAFEVGAPGFQTRKLVIDGSKTEISIGLRPTVGAQ